MKQHSANYVMLHWLRDAKAGSCQLILAALIVVLSANSGAAKIIITLLSAICVVYVSVSNKQMTVTNLQNLVDKNYSELLIRWC